MNINAKIILVCTITLVIFLSGAMFFMWKYLEELSASPLILGARKLAQANGADDLVCSCQLVGLKNVQQDPIFYFNTTRVWDQSSWARKDILLIP